MKGSLSPRRVFAVLSLAGLAACTPPKYVNYVSIHKDFSCSAPWGWNVFTDQEGDRFTNTTFVGPFEPDFHLGVPSLSIRWHAYSLQHHLRDGTRESYASVDDYIKQTLAEVYDSPSELVQPIHDIQVAGRKAKHFIVLAPAEVPKETKWGVSVDAKQRTVLLRQHAYVVLPLRTGFYVLVYPGTRAGYAAYEPHFNQLVNSFAITREGPDGPLSPVLADSRSPR